MIGRKHEIIRAPPIIRRQHTPSIPLSLSLLLIPSSAVPFPVPVGLGLLYTYCSFIFIIYQSPILQKVNLLLHSVALSLHKPVSFSSPLFLFFSPGTSLEKSTKAVRNNSNNRNRRMMTTTKTARKEQAWRPFGLGTLVSSPVSTPSPISDPFMKSFCKRNLSPCLTWTRRARTTPSNVP